MKEYTNEKLANEYLQVRLIGASFIRDFKNIARRIKNTEESISDFYEKHRSLKELRIIGIGEKTKQILELILEKGIEEVYKEMTEKEDRKIYLMGRGGYRFTGGKEQYYSTRQRRCSIHREHGVMIIRIHDD
ncbi:MAG: hypothetical protein AABX30_00380 [Nanoarchaeota archaeon]